MSLTLTAAILAGESPYQTVDTLVALLFESSASSAIIRQIYPSRPGMVMGHSGDR